jgi:hypothetical protein
VFVPDKKARRMWVCRASGPPTAGEQTHVCGICAELSFTNRHFLTFYVRIGRRELLSCAKSSRAPILVRAYPCEQGFCDSLSRRSAYVNCLLRERAYTCAKIQCGGPLLRGIGGPIPHHVALCVTGTELLVVELGQSICACVHAGDMYATPELLAPRLAPPCPALGAR